MSFNNPSNISRVDFRLAVFIFDYVLSRQRQFNSDNASTIVIEFPMKLQCFIAGNFRPLVDVLPSFRPTSNEIQK
jgi:hypothetical protein